MEKTPYNDYLDYRVKGSGFEVYNVSIKNYQNKNIKLLQTKIINLW